MKKLRWVVWTVPAIFVVLSAHLVRADENFPDRPIRIVTAAPGGGNDIGSRIIAQGVTGPLGVPVIVENRGSYPAREIVAHAEPDGHTLYVVGNVLWTGPLWQNEPYDPLAQFSPITMVATRPFLLVAHPSSKVNSVNDLIALAKARPKEIKIARTTLGSDGHLAVELLKSLAGIDVLVVPYGGSGPALRGVVSGQAQMSFSGLGAAEPFIRTGRLKAIAVTSLHPSTLSPGLPTVAASIPGYEIIGITGVYAPAKTPRAIINRLNREIVRYIKSPDGLEKFTAKGDEVVGSTPEEHVARIRSEVAKYGKLITHIAMEGK